MAKKSKKVSRSKPKKAKVDPIPKGFGTVTPYLTIDGAAEALEWYKKAFSAKELNRQAVPGGKIMHARIRIGDSILMLADVFPGGSTKDPKALGSTPVTLHVYTKNVDKLWQQAVDAGATVNMPLDNTFWGERYGQLRDPFGHNWSISMVIPMSKKEMKEKQEQAMAMFSQGVHPGAEEQAPMVAQ
jgi:PhnB protein